MIQRGYRALVLWIVWTAVAIIAYLSLYRSTDLLSFVEHDASHITWVILGLFAIGVVTSFIGVLLLTIEFVRADYLESIAAREGWPGIEHERLSLAIGKFFNSLKSVLKTNSQPDIEALVDIEFAVYHRFTGTLNMMGNLLITLGLVGTVVGLTLTLTGLTGSLQALGEDQDRLLRGLHQAMGGMGTAFYTTLLGAVLGGILLRVYAHIYEQGVENLAEVLARICLVYCSSYLQPSAQRDVHMLNDEIIGLTRSIQYLQTTLAESKSVIGGFIGELERLKAAEGEDVLLRKTLQLRHQHLESLRQEFQLKRMNRGAWWRAFIAGFRRT